MKFRITDRILPSWQNLLFAITAAVLLILAFPDFDLWFLGWFAVIPLIWAIERERGSVIKSFVLGWLFGFIFFFGTGWWLTYAPITFAGFSWPLAYALMVVTALIAGFFPALFAAILAFLIRSVGLWAILIAPFVWAASEFARLWLMGNSWNAIGYSQAFGGDIKRLAAIGGVEMVGFAIIAFASFVLWSNLRLIEADNKRPYFIGIAIFWSLLAIATALLQSDEPSRTPTENATATVIAIQPNVPMMGLDGRKWRELRGRQVTAAEAEIKKLSPERRGSVVVILPESPMNFMYAGDREFQQFINAFASRNNVSVLFNSAEPDLANAKYFNSAVMVGPAGSETVQYDKIYLLPFGEAVPWVFDGLIPGLVGNFAYGREYDLLPLGDARAGVMICFESHFADLSREYVRRGADAIIEMTNDGYLGDTPVLRQHLANAVFRAVETNRPLLRVTNVGITAYINEKGAVLDPAPAYQEDTRVWTVSKSDGKQTFYVRYGDWFAWFCSLLTVGLLIMGWRKELSSRVWRKDTNDGTHRTAN